MEKYVITIAREYGSGGRGIAHRLAEALGIVRLEADGVVGGVDVAVLD